MVGEVDGVYDLCRVQCVSEWVPDGLEAAPVCRSDIPHVDIVPETLQGEHRGLPADVPVCNVGLDAQDASLDFRHRVRRWCAARSLARAAAAFAPPDAFSGFLIQVTRSRGRFAEMNMVAENC